MVSTETSGGEGSARSRKRKPRGSRQTGVGILSAMLRRIGIQRVHIDELDARQLSVDEITIGNASVEQFRLSDLRTQVQTGRAFLNNVRTIVNLDIHVNWRVNLLFASPSDSFRLGSIPIPFNVGDVEIPELENLDIQVPSAVAEGSTLNIQSVHNLSFNGGRVADVTVTDLQTPVAGFALSGLDFDSVSLSHVGVPDAAIASVRIGSVQPDGDIRIPGIQVDGIGVADVQVPAIGSTRPISIRNADASDREITLINIGLLRVSITIKPSLDMNIARFSMQDLEATSTIDSLTLNNIRFPLSVNGINLSAVGAGRLRAEQLTV